MKWVVLTLSVLLAGGCTQWGNPVWRAGEAWWGCPDRHEACSDVDVRLTLVQMDNVMAGVKRDIEGSGPRRQDAALLVAQKWTVALEARGRIPQPPAWGDAMADYVQAAIDAERASARLLWE